MGQSHCPLTHWNMSKYNLVHMYNFEIERKKSNFQIIGITLAVSRCTQTVVL
jgi:hypothetical protein